MCSAVNALYANPMDDEPPSKPRQAENNANALDVEITDPHGLLAGDDLEWLRAASTQVCNNLANRGQVRVRLVDDQAMSDAHARYCGLNSTTDVLTFDLAHGEPIENKVLDTDLFVCIDEAARQAAARTHPVGHEALLYILHGVLHCLGYDDQDDESFARMHAREDELLDESGYGRVYSRETSGDQS